MFKSTQTSDEHAAYKFADDLFNQSLVQVMNGEQLGSKRVSFAINEYITRLNNSTATKKYSTTLRIQFLERILPLFNKTLIKDVKTATLMDIYDAMQINACGGQLSPNTYATLRIQEGVNHYILAKNMGTSVEMLEKHYGHTTNVTSAAELTKGGTFKGDKNKTSAIDWL